MKFYTPLVSLVVLFSILRGLANNSIARRYRYSAAFLSVKRRNQSKSQQCLTELSPVEKEIRVTESAVSDLLLNPTAVGPFGKSGNNENSLL